MLRLGLCCIFRKEPIKFRRTTAKYLQTFSRNQQLEYLAEICRHNAHSLYNALRYCSDQDIKDFRINSQILPNKTHPQHGYAIEALPQSNEIVGAFKKCKTYCRRHNLRTSFHPDQFNFLIGQEWIKYPQRIGPATDAGHQRVGQPALWTWRDPGIREAARAD